MVTKVVTIVLVVSNEMDIVGVTAEAGTVVKAGTVVGAFAVGVYVALRV